VTGLTVLVGNLGAVAAAAPLVWLLEVASWRTVFVAAGAVSLVLAALTWMVIRDTPAEAGLPTMRELDGLAPHPPHPGRWWHGLVEVGRNRDTWAPFLPAFGVAGTLLAFAGLWAVPFLHDAYGLTRAEAAAHTSVQLIGFAFGAMLMGTVSDRLGRRRSVMVAGIFAYLACWVPLVLLVPLAAPWSYLLFLVMGLGASGFTLAWSIAKEVNRPTLSGTATSVVNTGVFLGTALLQPLLGWLMDQPWEGRSAEGARVYPAASYQLSLGVLFLLSVAGLIGALLSRETRCRYVTN
jgi:sugar phosphate permease